MLSKIISYNIYFAFIFMIAGSGCVSQKVYINKVNGWRGLDIKEKAKIGIGYFDVSSARSKELKKNILSDSVFFNLQNRGFDVVENRELRLAMQKKSIPEDAILGEYELFRLADRFPGQYVLQGTMHEFVIDDGMKEKISLSLDCYVLDAVTGKRLASVKIFDTGLKQVTEKEIFMIARKLVRTLEK